MMQQGTVRESEDTKARSNGQGHSFSGELVLYFSVMFQNQTLTPRPLPRSARACKRSRSRLSSTLIRAFFSFHLSRPQLVSSREKTWLVNPASCARRTKSSNWCWLPRCTTVHILVRLTPFSRQ